MQGAARRPTQPVDGLPAAVVHDTPDTPTIQTLVDLMNARADLRRPDREWTAADTLKNVVVMLRHPDGTRRRRSPSACRATATSTSKRLEAAVLPAEAEPFAEADFAANPALVKGYIGPGALGEESASGIRFLVDPRVVDGHGVGHRRQRSPAATCSGSSPGATSRPTASSRPPRSSAGDPCPNCGAPHRDRPRHRDRPHLPARPQVRRGARPHGARPDGKQVVVTMGSYGIGVSRAVAAIAETTCDELGLCWPREVAPADVHVVIAGKPGGEQWPAAEQLATELEAAGVRVLLDDRDSVSPGVKFKDAELIGVPTIVVVGRGIADGIGSRSRTAGPASATDVPRRRRRRPPRRPSAATDARIERFMSPVHDADLVDAP